MDKIKTLSAAIRYGSKLKPQAFGSLFKCDPFMGVVHSCAVGAAYDGLISAGGGFVWGGTFSQADDFLRERFGDTALNRKLTIPGEGDAGPIEGSALEIIPCLNDSLRWSRERIADWLESQGL